MVPETLMERPLWIGSVEEAESERRLFQQNRPKAITHDRSFRLKAARCMYA